ncbi:MAG TPA: hypothetical protein DCS67_10670 [Clostridiales bacterium UBA8960]|nr:hypothetical protein [Clostridiales bacterium UBA8960]
MKKIVFVTILTFAFLLSGCQTKAPSFTMDTYPKIDGSTVTIPLSEALAARLTGQTVEAVRPYILHNKTHQAYVNLIEKKVDLIFVTSPSKEEMDLAIQKDVELEVVPIVSEAFVFLTHADNPVKNLSLDQIRDIYSGKIVNWSEVGGPDKAIVAYQRPINSGSQTGFLELIMQGEAPMEPPKEQIIAGMGMLIDAVAGYENEVPSIGYSYYYFVVDMWGNEDVKLLEVDGIYPESESIRNKTYPLTTAYYAVLRKDSTKDSPERLVVDYILSKAGQTLMEESGYVKISE